MQTAPGNAKYTINQIENQLIVMIGKLSKSEAVRKVNTARVCCLNADQSTDRQTRELMVIVCRYVRKYEKVNVTREDPVAVVNVFQTLLELFKDEKANTSRNFEESLDSKSLGRLHLSQVTKIGLDKVCRPKL
ncbi:hypothetical protein QYM36_003313 [Artemia franciscana]|uniref:Uncharacterized protein n=1 Tax=Artemia franciscana TaxID=6661 RepID=A0AA88L968_ARTSF|nr:hypothetical protein QYM36_003313 [Artemia franciscana]